MYRADPGASEAAARDHEGRFDREAVMRTADIDILRHTVTQARRRGDDPDLEMEMELWDRTQRLNAFWGGAEEDWGDLGMD